MGLAVVASTVAVWSRPFTPIWSAGPFVGVPCAKLPIGCLPFVLPFVLAFVLARTILRPGFSLRSSFSFDFLRLAALFSASFLALRSALAFNRSRSALASARFFLRFFSQASHLQPIGLDRP